MAGQPSGRGGIAIPSRRQGSTPPQAPQVLGTSPGPRSKQASGKRFWRTLVFDVACGLQDPEEWQIGFVETEEAPERKSGAEAWSMRLRDRVVELPYSEFCARFADDVPYHRIAFFKQLGAVVWESDELRSKLHPGDELYGSSGGGGGLHGSWHHGGSWQAHAGWHAGPSPLAGAGARGAAPRLAGSSPQPPAAFGFARPPSSLSGSSPPQQQQQQGRERHAAAGERPRGGVSSLLAAAAAGDQPSPSGSGGARGSPASSDAPRGKTRRRRPQSGGPAAGGDDDACWHQGDQAGAVGSWPRDGSGSHGTPTPPPRRGSSRSAGAARELSGTWEGGASPAAAPPLPRHLARGRAGGAALDGAASDDGSEGCGVFDVDEDDGDDGGLLGELEEEEGGAEGEGAGGGGERGCGVCGGAPPPPLELRDYGLLPDNMWLSILGAGLGVRDLCYVARASKGLRAVAVNSHGLWAALYKDLHGEAAPVAWGAQAVRRACRRSELRAARWLEAAAPRSSAGFASTTCIALDGTKAVTGDGSCVRVWSHGSGRRIATLPGHPGRLSGVAFDDDTLVSGCAGGVVRLWSVDELRCTRSLRHHAGAVTAVALLNGVPISAGEEGEICLWDAAAGAGAGGAPILSLAADGPVAALDAAAASGHLVSAGVDVDLWDMAAAQRLATLVAPPQEGAGAGGNGGFSCVGSGGSLIAAGRAGQVALWDVRSSRCVGTIDAAASARVSAACGAAPHVAAEPAPELAKQGGGADAGAVDGEAGAAGTAAAAAPPCMGVQLDDWKLVAGWAGPERALRVYDLRSLAGGSPRAGWAAPVLTLRTPARVTCFRFHEQTLIAGQEGADCTLWSFGSPQPTAAPAWAQAAGSDGDAGHGQDGSGGGGSGGRRRKEKKAAVPKGRDRRYPKRRTR